MKKLSLTSMALVLALACHAARAQPKSAMVGVNLSGAELNPGPGKRLNFDYTYPTSTEIDYFADKGFNTIRLPFDLTRLYPHPYGDLAPEQLTQIKAIVTHAAGKNMRVVLDPHNFGEIYDARVGRTRLIGRDAEGTHLFADFWRKIATAFKASPSVTFGLMNEPKDQTPLEWRAGATEAIDAIRASGATQMILIPGTYYTGAHSWAAPGGNGEAWADFHGDPLGNFAFEMHQYLDSNSSGVSAQCKPGSGANRMREATAWLDRNHFKGFLAEFAWSVDPSCRPEAKALMDFLTSNAKTWIGWTWWAAGPWWPTSYPFSLEPIKVGQGTSQRLQDREQMSILLSALRDRD